MRRRADVDFSRLAARLKLVGQGDVISEKAITWHPDSDYTCQY